MKYLDSIAGDRVLESAGLRVISVTDDTNIRASMDDEMAKLMSDVTGLLKERANIGNDSVPVRFGKPVGDRLAPRGSVRLDTVGAGLHQRGCERMSTR